ncbi:MAG TPA: isoprenyl transferase [Chloroflexota bacterium]|jgi:undecaprenyl diphosphate synthase|nr:isoprenyl transferase [Chloroflexota bacterium]
MVAGSAQAGLQPTTGAETTAQPETIPTHVGIIMDGNGRWAKRRSLPRLAGHHAGTENVRRITMACADVGVEVLTIYAFSTENWRRPQDEVLGLMRLLAQRIDKEAAELHKNNVQIRHVGELDGIQPRLADRVRAAVKLTEANSGLILNVAFNYGGRQEIARAVQRVLASGVRPDEVTEELIDRHLDTAGLPDLDLVIRTGGEMRLSNFLLWQSAYAEYYATPICWPDFGRDELLAAFAEFGRRARRFGGLS